VIMLTELTLGNKGGHNRVVKDKEHVGIDALSVVTVRKYMYGEQRVEGSLISLADGHAPIVAEETVTEVIQMVEVEVNRLYGITS